MSYAPKAGYEWNPLRAFPRNDLCFCKSGKKFKRCCMNGLKVVLPHGEVLDRVKRFMENYKKVK